jgi:hypothetical protein
MRAVHRFCHCNSPVSDYNWVGEYNEDDDENGFFKTLNTQGGMMRN